MNSSTKIFSCEIIQEELERKKLEDLSSPMIFHIQECEKCQTYYHSLSKNLQSNFMSMVFSLYGSMIFFALLWIALQDKGFDRIYSLFFRKATYPLDLTIGLIIALVVVFFSRISSLYFGWAKEMEKNFKNILGDLKFHEIVLMALLSGIGEELFFRGAMQYSLGLISTSLIFGFLHFMPPASKEGKTEELSYKHFIWTIFAVVMGFVLGYAHIYTGNLLAPMVAHVFINGINLTFINWSRVK